MSSKIYWGKRNNGKAILMVRNLISNKSWISYYFRGKGESVLNIKWKKHRKGFEEHFKTIK